MSIKSRSEAKTQIDANLPDPGTITPELHREVEYTLADSAVLFGEAEVRVENMTTATPPGSPSDRVAYVVASSGTGDFAGQDNNIAIWDGSVSPSAWVFHAPADGTVVFDKGTNRRFRWDAVVSPSEWVPVSRYDMTVIVGSTTPSDGEILFRHTAVVDEYFPADFAGSRGAAPDTNPGASFQMTVRKQDNSTSPTGYTTLGTVTISTGGVYTLATTGSASQTVSAGEEIQVVAPSDSPTEASIAGFSFTFKATAAGILMPLLVTNYGGSLGAGGGGGDGGGGGGALSSFAGDLATRPWISATTWPSAVHFGTKTYIGYVAETPPQTAKVLVYDHGTETFAVHAIDTVALADDDHGSVSLCVLSDGRMAAFYGSHNSDQQWSISDQSGGVPDVSNWTRQSAISGNYTYPKPVNIDGGSGAGDLYLFMRRRDSSSDYPLVVRKASYTSGGAVSFGSDTELVELSGRVYSTETRADASDNIEFVATRADGSDTLRRHVYYFKYITATGAVENLGGGTSTASGSLPIDLTLANSDYREVDTGTNHTGLVSSCRDTNGDLHILYGDDTDGAATFDVKHNVYDQSGGTWGTASTPLTVKDRNSGSGSVDNWCLVPLDTGDNVEAWYPKGDTGGFSVIGGDSIARKVYASGSFGSEEVIHTGTNSRALAFPTAVFSADADFRVAFAEITQSTTGTDREALERYGYGDSGFVQFPALTDSRLYTVALLLGFNGSDAATTTEDESHWAHLHPVTFNADAQLDTAQSKFGGSSLLLDGTGDYLTVAQSNSALAASPGTEWKLAAGDTWEVFFRPNSLAANGALLSTRKDNGSADGWLWLVQSDGTVRFLGWDSGTVVVDMTTTGTVGTGAWHYSAVKRLADGSYELWLDGTSEDTDPDATIAYESQPLNIGRNSGNNGAFFNGWIDEIRVSKGLLRDVSTVPTSAFPRS